MGRNRWQLLLALLLALALGFAAACGGDDDEEEEEAAPTEQVSGSVTILADWTGAEGEAFQAVLDGFKRKYPNVNARYRPSTNLTQDLSTAVEGGNPPHLAAIPSPGIMRDYQERGALKPIEFARDVVQRNYSRDWLNLGLINRRLYGVFFKGANKSTVWYNKHAFEQAGVEPPETFDDLLQAMETIKAAGIAPVAIGGSEGWTLTDVFENIYARTAGPEKYRQLAAHQIKWTDPSVREALRMTGQIFQSENLLGGTSGALQLAFADSVTRVLAPEAQVRAALNFQGDFVPGVARGQTQAKAGTDYDFFEFPGVEGSEPVVVSGGNVVVMFRDNPAARALVEYLATPEAGEIWARRGGFTSPNKNVSEDVYPDEITRRFATAVAQAENVVFDMSDLAPGEFGSGDEWSILQGFLRNPSDVDGTAQKLEAAAARAYR